MKRAAIPAVRARIVFRIADVRWRAHEGLRPLMRRAMQSGLALARPGGGDVTVLLADDAKLMQLNGTFRGRNTPTNVLSFPSAEPGYAGDIAIAYETVAREAEAQGKGFAAHASHLALHGTLHLLGYDHETGPEAEEMEELERQALKRLGIADPYAAPGKAA
jgi:probable rRNA maturation factor